MEVSLERKEGRVKELKGHREGRRGRIPMADLSSHFLHPFSRLSLEGKRYRLGRYTVM